MVEGGSVLWIISVYGTPIPTGTADQVNSYLREAAISIEWFLGLASCRFSPSKKNLAKTIARDKPVSTFECTRKHYEHGYNITRDNHAPKYFYDDNVCHELNETLR